MPSTISVKAISLAPAITVNDLDASLRFYQGLGYAIDERWENEGKLMGAMLSAGNAHVNLSQDDFAKGKDRVKGIGFRMFFNTDQDLDEIAAAIKNAGIAVPDGIKSESWGRSFTVTDPDGFKTTFFKESKES